MLHLTDVCQDSVDLWILYWRTFFSLNNYQVLCALNAEVPEMCVLARFCSCFRESRGWFSCFVILAVHVLFQVALFTAGYGN
jgi:hypothetical protein